MSEILFAYLFCFLGAFGFGWVARGMWARRCNANAQLRDTLDAAQKFSAEIRADKLRNADARERKSDREFFSLFL